MKFFAFAGWMLPLLLAAEPAAKPESKEKFLSNGKIKIGLDLSSGGSIFWFSELPEDRNLLNHHDRGRFIQQSFYGQEDGSKWVNKPWRWNPVQGGDYKGKPARVLESQELEDRYYVKSIPVNWAGGEDLEECRMEEWIKLEGNVAHLRFRFTYGGEASHPPRHQELPAVFVDYDLADLVYYRGDAPWTGAALQKDVPGWPNESREISEEWAGFVGADGRGVGVYFPGTRKITCYRYQGQSGPKGAGCSYFAPIQTLSVTPGFVHEYDVHLTIGSPEEMRERFDGVRKSKQP
jgi:hypothetical protein